MTVYWYIRSYGDSYGEGEVNSTSLFGSLRNPVLTVLGDLAEVTGHLLCCTEQPYLSYGI